MANSMDRFRKIRSVPFVKRGMRVVTHTGEKGHIIGPHYSGCLKIKIDGRAKP